MALITLTHQYSSLAGTECKPRWTYSLIYGDNTYVPTASLTLIIRVKCLTAALCLIAGVKNTHQQLAKTALYGTGSSMIFNDIGLQHQFLCFDAHHQKAMKFRVLSNKERSEKHGPETGREIMTGSRRSASSHCYQTQNGKLESTQRWWSNGNCAKLGSKWLFRFTSKMQKIKSSFKTSFGILSLDQLLYASAKVSGVPDTFC